MTVQTSFSEWEYAGKKNETRRDRFLAEIDAITPRLALEQTVTPFYPKRGGRAWPPLGLSRMLRLVHTVIGTAGNVSDNSQAEALLHGQKTMVFADAGYQGVEKRPESQGSEVEWQVAMKPSKRKQLAGTELGRLTTYRNVATSESVGDDSVLHGKAD